MSLERKPFVPYKLEDERDQDKYRFTIRLNEKERSILDKCKKTLEQPKDSTTLKQLAWIGAKVIHEPSTQYLLGMVFKNKRNNERLGIVEYGLD